jgi:hypothetical protein
MDLVPKKPVPFGSNSLYPKKEKTFPLEFFHKHRWSIHNKYIENTMNYEKIRQMESLLEEQVSLDNEALNE